jgi:hypothetical protein
MPEETPANPALEIISDEEADIVKGAHRWKIQGGLARRIVSAYRHCLGHPDTGPADAALYLWGLTDGLHHAALVQAEDILERSRERRLDAPHF